MIAQAYREMSREEQARANRIFLQGGDLAKYAIACNQAEIYASKAQREEDITAREQELKQLKASEQKRLKSILGCL